MHFDKIINKYRALADSHHGTGSSFERLMVCFLRTFQVYDHTFSKVWLWHDFPYRESIGLTDVGIDLVAKTVEGEFWAVQCKCYQENDYVSKESIDGFIATSGRIFRGPDGQDTAFSRRLLISTSDNWSQNAENAIRNQVIPFNRISLTELREARVDWEELDKGVYGQNARSQRHDPRPHQSDAVEAFHRHFKDHDRGKLILPCGTGKTFTALKVAERETGGKGLVLFFAPSIALVGQTLREWTAETKDPLVSICVCSDRDISKKYSHPGDDSPEISVEDLALPASTSPPEILSRLRAAEKERPNSIHVIFSTYQSIEAVAKAISKLGRTIDLIICDEAHRTTGHILAGEDESHFVKVHDQAFLPAEKRLYMTATPRIYGEGAKQRAKENSVVLFSMDNSDLYGKEVYRMGFGEAVRKKLLSDYKVLVLTIPQENIPKSLMDDIADGKKELDTSDAVRFLGCIYALSKRMDIESGILREVDPGVMHKAVAFCRTIKDSKKITEVFNRYRETFYEDLSQTERDALVKVEAQHVDGTMGSSIREKKMSWLKDVKNDSKDCHILTNVRCLSEGVDVPSLDAVIFLSQKNSEIEVVQSVGRVMRRAKGKTFGYIIIPIVVAPDVPPEIALNDNKTYKVVWDVLNALKSHDDRFNAKINQIRFNERKPEDGGSVLIGGPATDNSETDIIGDTRNLLFRGIDNMGEYRDAIYAKLVKKVGSQSDMLNWAKDVGEVAKRYAERIKILVDSPGKNHDEFQKFLKDLQENLNPSVDSEEAIRMLAQHMVTKPVFEALFDNYSFAKNNPVSMSLQSMIDLLEEQALRKDAKNLEGFYDEAAKRIEVLDTARVKEFVTGIDNAAARQKIIVDLYGTFFKSAFPDVVERLGVVYTPVEIVDFMINSVAKILEKEFGLNISDKTVNILEPFCGTGTFLTRLIQSGLLGKSLERKYQHELNANEIVLLAYYIASINIENEYHAAMGDESQYTPFNGICLTDTFQLYEKDISLGIDNTFKQNIKRANTQKATPIMVIISNPPYSIGQKVQDDNASNLPYPYLDNRIANTYANDSVAGLKKSLYDSYIRAFRWATDRINHFGDKRGIIAFVTNAGWIDGNAMDGMRKYLPNEFSSLYIFNLRGNARTSGEQRRKESGNVFGATTRAPIAITILIKNVKNTEPAKIYYYDIGDYHSTDKKLQILTEFHDIYNTIILWKEIIPNMEGDWFSQRNEVFKNFIPLGDKDNKLNNITYFYPYYSLGLVTARDSWCYNFSKSILKTNIKNTINFYNEQREKFQKITSQSKNLNPNNFIEYDRNNISWTSNLIHNLVTDKIIKYSRDSITISLYRPFTKKCLYFNRALNERVYQIPKLFPTANHNNLVICCATSKSSLPLMSKYLPDFQINFNSQCFPRYYYTDSKGSNQQAKTLFNDENEINGYVRHDGITDYILNKAKEKYGNDLPEITKDQIYYYVYGVLHSTDYRENFASDLKRMIPRLNLVKSVNKFKAFSDAGRELAKLHVNYENFNPPRKVIVSGEETGNFHVEKMRFGKEKDKSIIHYNSQITISNIPLEAYNYIINSRSAIEWVMEFYRIKVDKDSGIKQDPNDWAKETGNPRYILDLLLSLITVSLETLKIIEGLPKLKFNT